MFFCREQEHFLIHSVRYCFFIEQLRISIFEVIIEAYANCCLSIVICFLGGALCFNNYGYGFLSTNSLLCLFLLSGLNIASYILFWFNLFLNFCFCFVLLAMYSMEYFSFSFNSYQTVFLDLLVY